MSHIELINLTCVALLQCHLWDNSSGTKKDVHLWSAGDTARATLSLWPSSFIGVCSWLFLFFHFSQKGLNICFFFQIWSLKNKSQISIVRKGSVEGQIWKERKNNDRKNEKKKEKGSLVQSIYSQFTIHNGFKNKTPHLLQCFCYLELRGSLLDKSLFRAGYDKKKKLNLWKNKSCFNTRYFISQEKKSRESVI